MSSMEDLDQKMLIVLTDANFERYGIYPEDFGRLLTTKDDVDAFAIMIGMCVYVCVFACVHVCMYVCTCVSNVS